LAPALAEALPELAGEPALVCASAVEAKENTKDTIAISKAGAFMVGLVPFRGRFGQNQFPCLLQSPDFRLSVIICKMPTEFKTTVGRMLLSSSDTLDHAH
jgi:hypothetical protein